MEFIQLTEIKRLPGGSSGETQIIRKISVPIGLIAIIAENKLLMPPKDFYSDVKGTLSTSTVFLNCCSQLREIPVAENYNIIKESLRLLDHKILLI